MEIEKFLKNFDNGTLTSILSLKVEGEEENRQIAVIIMEL